MVPKDQPTIQLFVREESGFRFEWLGGPYIDILTRNKSRKNQQEDSWISNNTIRPPGWYISEVNIGVWDYSKGGPSIPVTKKAFDKKVDEWLKDNDAATSH